MTIKRSIISEQHDPIALFGPTKDVLHDSPSGSMPSLLMYTRWGLLKDGGATKLLLCSQMHKVVLFCRRSSVIKDIAMRLVTWNCCMGLDKKLPRLLALACSTDYSIEAKRVADAFRDQLVSERIPG
jgi:hypothetical protein